MTLIKAELFTKLAAVPDDDPRLDAVAGILNGSPDGTLEGKALTISGAAARAGLSRPCLYRAMSAGTLRSFTPYPGAHPRITEKEVARWMGTRTTRQ